MVKLTHYIALRSQFPRSSGVVVLIKRLPLAYPPELCALADKCYSTKANKVVNKAEEIGCYG